ncbi:MAG: AAA family ATPase [Euryarchaeota archaeon]|nr:AAA family ATPase [Euryarchaeota archaeon]MDE2044433.1 AAA family ATPase [Thermoplasmata archaeon]
MAARVRPPAVARSPCMGRERESAELLSAASSAAEGHGGTWLLSGPPGIGKTHLMKWLAQTLRASDFTVLEGSFSDRNGTPLAKIEEVFAKLEPSPARSAPPSTGAPLSRVPPALALLRHVQALLKASQARPVALLFDDAQRADPESIGAFHLLSRAMGGIRGLLVVALGEQTGASEPEGDPFWKRTLALLSEEGSLHRVALAGLDGSAASRVIESVSKASLEGAEGWEILQGLLGRSGGNPLFLRELVELLLRQHQLVVEGGRLHLQGAGLDEGSPKVGGGWGRFPLPPSLRRLVLSRLDHVLPADLQLLEAAALLGSPFELEPLVGVLDRSHRDLAATCQDLVRLSLLQPQGPEDEEESWSFAHDLVWEVVLREAETSGLRDLSGRLARWWSLERPDEVETVARLFHDAREPLEGIRWVRDAIDRALRSGATAAAERYFQWYFDLLSFSPQPAEQRARETLELVDRLLVRRLRRETLGVLKQLETAHPTEEMRWQVGWREVHVLVSFDLPRAERRLEELTRSLEGSKLSQDPLRRAQLAFARCEVLGARLEWAEAIAAGVESLGLQGEGASAWERGRLLYELGWDHMMLGRLGPARELLEELRALTAVAEVPALAATGRVLEGTLALMEGNLRAAAEAYREASSRLLEMGAMEGYGTSKANLAEVLVQLGELEGARQALKDAELVGTRFGYPRVLQGCALEWAWVHAAEGRWREVLASLEESEKGGREGDFSEELWEARLLHAWALGETSAPNEALVELERVRREEGKLQPHLRPYLPRVEGRLLELAGRPGAREALERALDAARRYSGPEGQAEAWREIARWERSHGGGEAAERAEREASRLTGRARLPAGDLPPLPTR